MKKMTFWFLLYGMFILNVSLFAQVSDVQQKIIGSALSDNQSYQALEQICDNAGGRFMGSDGNVKAMEMLKNVLTSFQYSVNQETFTAPGWIRGNDSVVMISPVSKVLRAVALGYVNHTPAFEASVIFAGYGFREDYDSLQVKGKIVLVTSEKPADKTPLLRYEAIDIAAEMGARAILFINTKPGMLVLAGTGNFQGNATAIPAYSIPLEHGQWIRRLLGNKTAVTAQIITRSLCTKIETANLVATLAGKSKRKIVVGAHVDSWDLGQGAIDNGLGTAILLDVARLLKAYSPNNYYTVELVWFNGEELGLWGSKNYLRMHDKDDIAAMINMDMTGTPTGLNAMGFDYLVPFLNEVRAKLGGFNLDQGVISRPYTNSDHQPFMLAGIPTLSLRAHLDDDMVRYYHDYGDTFDKVNKQYLSEAAAVVTALIYRLANNQELKLRHYSENETISMLKNFKLDDRLKRQKEWPF